MSTLQQELPDEDATASFAAKVAGAVDDGAVIYLHGDLGAGKTSFARAFLRALGVGERVKSPTYSLVESYGLDAGRLNARTAWHLDLYRIADPGELEWLGLDALADPTALVLVEWPERGAGALPAPDLQIDLAYAGTGRVVQVAARSPRGTRLLARLPASS
ncbi:tRNA (adenosine(37)-N6)-threonylcarbamoyltransferase complex ATPase subunit type 1 TsaE [Dyella sp. 2RAB6]|uniref:tRNA (adenosine(37)-N6)-threonylcarbamoyltransferase complex ATPase subunit type 1 TsaE n=1 Tax=Dyella sp. 2RAB6 TaxID=3232992 RepID=UPI003F8DFB42